MRAKDTYYYNFHRLAFVMGAVKHKKHKQMFYKMYVTCLLDKLVSYPSLNTVAFPMSHKEIVVTMLIITIS